MNKPTPETISYYSFSEVCEYIKEKYQILNDTFFNEWAKFNPYDGEILVLHIADYIVYKKYDSKELLEWYECVRKEFGDAIMLEWDAEYESLSKEREEENDRINSLPIEFLYPSHPVHDLLYEFGLYTVGKVRNFFCYDIHLHPEFDKEIKKEIIQLFLDKLNIQL